MSLPDFGYDITDSDYVPPSDDDDDDEHAELDDDDVDEDDYQESGDEPDEIEVDLEALFNQTQTNTESPAATPAASAMLTGIQQFLQRVAGSDGSLPPEIQALLRNANARVSWQRASDDEEEDDDDDEPGYAGYFGNTRAQDEKWFPDVTEPVPAGVELLQSGEFGRLGPLLDERARRTKTLGQRLRASKMSPRSANRQDIARPLVPNTCGTIVAKYDSNPYSGQFSADSSFFYTCCQDFRLHIYDTSSPPRMRNGIIRATPSPTHSTTMKTMKTIQGVTGNWTITDSHLSPDNERMIYSSINTVVHLTHTRDADNRQIPIELGDRVSSGRGWRTSLSSYRDSFGIYSCRFSADGNEIIAGGSGNLLVYDLIAERRTSRIPAHDDDVNSCCWADSASGNVLISASDDTFLKVWDRRSLGADAKPAGVLIGHTEGITYVSPKGDGRYVVSNGKDQTMRLWDLRKMRSHSEWEALPDRTYGLGKNWDYRNGRYRKPRHDAHPQNCSVMAYRGHHVFRTLIRCHFSPEESTGGSYLYTGSSDGRIHIYSLDGRIVQVLDRSKALPISFDPSEPEPPMLNRSGIAGRTGRYGYGTGRTGVVRDVSWHNTEPVLMSVAWGPGGYDGDGGDVARHEWKGMGKNGMKLEDVVERDVAEAGTAPGGGGSPVFPGAY